MASTEPEVTDAAGSSSASVGDEQAPAEASASESVVDRVIAQSRPRKPVEVAQALASVRSKLFGEKESAVKIWRYVLLDRIAAGGVGVVYRAYDPELDRRVAVKLLHTKGDDESSEARLAREAQAMAQVSHPNVVTVHDVGHYSLSMLTSARGNVDDAPRRGVFVVMELLDGVDLAQWLEKESPSIRRILEVFVAAGQGLAAAHRVGLVHRDFKPANVVVCADGIPKVLDFGLARAQGQVPDEDKDEQPRRPLHVPITREGSIMGTPPYMAPEQHRGLPADPRSDQFSFCVALYQALQGRLPFRGETLDELQRKKELGLQPEDDLDARIPRRVRDLVRRGLSPDPAARFDSMDDLVAALRPPRRVGVAVLGLGAVLGLAGGLGWWTARQDPPPVCADDAQRLAGIWDDDVRTQVERAFTETGASYAAHAWGTVETELDAYTLAWTDARQATCQSMLDGGLDAEEAASRLTCLDQALRRVDELTALFERADADVVRNAVDAVSALPPLADCEDVLPLPRDVDARDEVLAIDAELARIEALLAGGRFVDALEEADRLRGRAEQVGHPRTRAGLFLLLGRAARLAGEHDISADALFRAAVAARKAGLNKQAGRAFTELAITEGLGRSRLEEAERYATLAAVELADTPTGDLSRADLSTALGLLRSSQGRHDEAEVELDSALSTLRKRLGDAHPRIAVVSSMRARVHHLEGEYDEALALEREALSISTAALGHEHPTVAAHHISIALLATLLGDPEQAEVHHERAIEVLRSSLGEDHPDYLRALNNLGLALFLQGRFAEAEEHFREVLRRKEAASSRPAADPSLAATLNNLGAILAELGRYEEALAFHERALAIRQMVLPEDHPEVGASLMNKSQTLLQLGRLPEALRAAQRGLEIAEATFDDGAQLVEALRVAGEIRLALGEGDEAGPLFERAQALAPSAGLPRWELGDLAFARARLVAIEDPEEARELARAAEAVWGDGEGAALRLKRLAAWRAELQ